MRRFGCPLSFRRDSEASRDDDPSRLVGGAPKKTCDHALARIPSDGGPGEEEKKKGALFSFLLSLLPCSRRFFGRASEVTTREGGDQKYSLRQRSTASSSLASEHVCASST